MKLPIKLTMLPTTSPRIMIAVALLLLLGAAVAGPALLSASDAPPPPKAAEPAKPAEAPKAEAPKAEAKAPKAPVPCGESSLPPEIRLQYARDAAAAACLVKDKAGLTKALVFDQRCVVGGYVVVLGFFALFFAWVERRPLSILESAILVLTIVAALADGLENLRTMDFLHRAGQPEGLEPLVASMGFTAMVKWLALGLAVALAGMSLLLRDWLYHRATAAMVLAGAAMVVSPFLPWAGVQPWVGLGGGLLALAGVGLAAVGALRGK